MGKTRLAQQPGDAGWAYAGVEVKRDEPPSDAVVVRCGRFPNGPVLRFTPQEWGDFLHGARNGDFDEFAHPKG